MYGPLATVIQKFAAIIGGSSVASTIWVLMILNGLVFIGVGVLLLKTSDDPIRATLFWVANRLSCSSSSAAATLTRLGWRSRHLLDPGRPPGVRALG